MCGIAGIVNATGEAADAALRKMTSALEHRGPDDAGTITLSWGASELALGHRRLSIIDVSQCGHQPMVHPLTGDTLVFNGEIYNFLEIRKELETLGERFTGSSDTEVLLHALSYWGADCIRRLNGMYAFAFYNQKQQNLILARDPAGIKPLYISESGGRILFASEVRAMLASGLVSHEIDRRGLATYFAFGAMQRPYTLFTSINEFPPGCYEVVSPPARRSVTRFWSFPKPNPRIDAAEACCGLRERLSEAVRDQMVADVPLGVFLSSGIDSTIIAALAAQQREGVHAFTVGFSDHPDLSEQSVAIETARALGLRHTAINVSGDDTLHATERWLQSMDQPSVDGLNVFVISGAIRSHGIKVALAGNGGDELFGGYTGFWEVPFMMRAMRWTSWVNPRIRSMIAYGGLTLLRYPEAVRDKAFDVAAIGRNILGLYFQRRRMMSSFQLNRLGCGGPLQGLSADYIPTSALEGVELEHDDTMWNLSMLECSFYQPNTLLRDADVNAMAHGLEIRVPLLDQRVIDFANAIPGQVRLPPAGRPKQLLRTTFGAVLSHETLTQNKRGFVLPLRRWMAGPLRGLCEESMASLKSTGLVAAAGVDEVWNLFLREPESAIWSRALSLCVLGNYLRKLGL